MEVRRKDGMKRMKPTHTHIYTWAHHRLTLWLTSVNLGNCVLLDQCDKQLRPIVHLKKSLADKQEVGEPGFEQQNSSRSHSAASQLSLLLSGDGGNTCWSAQWCCWDYRPLCWRAAWQRGRGRIDGGAVCKTATAWAGPETDSRTTSPTSVILWGNFNHWNVTSRGAESVSTCLQDVFVIKYIGSINL